MEVVLPFWVLQLCRPNRNLSNSLQMLGRLEMLPVVPDNQCDVSFALLNKHLLFESGHSVHAPLDGMGSIVIDGIVGV